MALIWQFSSDVFPMCFRCGVRRGPSNSHCLRYPSETSRCLSDAYLMTLYIDMQDPYHIYNIGKISERHRKGIGKASERHRKDIGN